jgi:hypothetical protein
LLIQTLSLHLTVISDLFHQIFIFFFCHLSFFFLCQRTSTIINFLTLATLSAQGYLA